MAVAVMGAALLAAGLLVALGVFAAARPAEAAFPGANSKIAFTSKVGDREIFSMNPDGTGVTQLTFNTENDYVPAYSADGKKMAFTSALINPSGPNNYEVYVMDANGANPTLLTNNAARDDHPAWSPSGKKIVFTSNRNGNLEIYVMNRDGSNQQNRTNNPGVEDFQPDWQPV